MSTTACSATWSRSAGRSRRRSAANSRARMSSPCTLGPRMTRSLRPWRSGGFRDFRRPRPRIRSGRARPCSISPCRPRCGNSSVAKPLQDCVDNLAGDMKLIAPRQGRFGRRQTLSRPRRCSGTHACRLPLTDHRLHFDRNAAPAGWHHDRLGRLQPMRSLPRSRAYQVDVAFGGAATHRSSRSEGEIRRACRRRLCRRKIIDAKGSGETAETRAFGGAIGRRGCSAHAGAAVHRRCSKQYLRQARPTQQDRRLAAEGRADHRSMGPGQQGRRRRVGALQDRNRQFRGGALISSLATREGRIKAWVFILAPFVALSSRQESTHQPGVL